jgi:glycogen debranching enzyme
MIEFGREICGDLANATRREWLVTNSIGGYASSTVSGLLTRRYHGLLIAATKPFAEQVKTSFARFWNEKTGYLYSQ